MSVQLVSTFFGAYAVENGAISQRFAVPEDALADRLRTRRDGRRTPEESLLLDSTQGLDRVTRDRRLAIGGVRLETLPQPRIQLPEFERFDSAWRDLLLHEGGDALAQAWDPSVLVDEAVRALAEYDEIQNLLAERAESWKGRVAVITDGVQSSDPALSEALEQLNSLVQAVVKSRSDLERTLERVTPDVAPNLAVLLGPLLAARMISQARGLARLARLPASTIQVLGAERAFFDHLRGRGPPPRHGLLFIHPDIQGAPRAVRGRVARALAGKVAIAARLDFARRPVDSRLLEQFRERSRRARSSPKVRRKPSRPDRGRR